ncbi:MAG: glycoside hydrolase [Candidatus Eisenbacteria bacterium]
MDAARAPVDLLFLWHHHQPDYRRPDGGAVLPWVRLHATKDYLDMALHLERHPGLRATFNLVPSLLDQLDDAVAGRPDALFDLLRQPPGQLTAPERAEVVRRCRMLPPHARDRWPQLRRLLETRAGGGEPATWPDARLIALECWFLLGWTDPTLFGEPEAAAALATDGRFDVRHRDALLALHARLTARVLPAYRDLAERGQCELSCSPYHHPILPLLVDISTLRRARPDLPLPAEPFAAPEDAERQIRLARERHERAFGTPPLGMWPSEGSLSPEAVAIAARCGVRWLASDEGVLWRSLGERERKRGLLYRPWSFATPDGAMTLFFRDRELSDRIGFVYQKWDPVEAARDLVTRVRRIGDEHGREQPALVSVILDGENCWEGYADDGAPFIEALYGMLETSPDIRTRTPSDVLRDGPAPLSLERLHSGSWIDADFHIWAGQSEKNRAWDALARARRALVGANATPDSHPPAWRALERAEGSDWFWWYGDDHYTSDKAVFDALFREHVRAAYAGAGLEPPVSLQAAIARPSVAPGAHTRPIGFVSPVIDGRSTQYYEWYEAGHLDAGGGGGAMHREGGLVTRLHYGYDAKRFYLRLDFADGAGVAAGGAPASERGPDAVAARASTRASKPPGTMFSLRLDFAAPRVVKLVVSPIAPGVPTVRRAGESDPMAGAECRIDRVLELALPFAGLGYTPGESVELVVSLAGESGPIESIPADDVLSFIVPAATDDLEVWGL